MARRATARRRPSAERSRYLAVLRPRCPGGGSRNNKSGLATKQTVKRMAKRGFWTKERTLLGQPVIEETADTYWMLKLVHPPGASAMALGAVGGGSLTWKLLENHGLIMGIVAVLLAAVVGAWVGLLLYWLLRMVLGLGD